MAHMGAVTKIVSWTLGVLSVRHARLATPQVAFGYTQPWLVISRAHGSYLKLSSSGVLSGLLLREFGSTHHP